MDWPIFFKYLSVLLLCVAGTVLLAIAYRLITSNENEYRLNKLRSGHWYTPLIGGLSTFHDGHRDDRVCAGLAVDRRSNTWHEQGALSEEAVDSVIRHS